MSQATDPWHEKGSIQSGDVVEITGNAVRKWFSRNANELKRALAPHLVEAFKQSVTYHRGNDGFDYAADLINLDGKDVAVRVCNPQKQNRFEKTLPG